MAGINTKTKKTVKSKKSGAKTIKKSALKKSATSFKNGTVKPKKSVNKSSGKTTSKNKVIKELSVKKSVSGKPLGKTYLKDKDLKFFAKLIIEQKNEILENARRLRESLIDENTGDYVGDNSTFSMHMAEQGTDEMEREKAYMFIQRDEKHLFYLESALERIAKKTYGLCISCGKAINKARLEAVPITSHCIHCKQSFSG
ncbi:MAG: TraR/DksA C4-type zinc finger protein [Ignavibacteria bacterium]|nr:TraR/DksA C4-type zinc finger protein [Ignavibacteria bacterium]